MRLDHIGIAVENLETAESFWGAGLGLPLEGREEVAEQGVTVSFLPVGEPRIELLEPLATNPGPVGRFLEQRGPGIHHICLRVNDLDSLLAQLDNAGIQLIDKSPRQGAHGMRIAFVHPKATGGVLLELAEPAPSE